MAAISPRDLVRRFMEGAPTDRVPVVMHLGAYAARLQHARFQEVAYDATLLANSLQSAQKLLGCDGLIVTADPTVEAEACGCAVAWPDDEPQVTSHPWAGDVAARDMAAGGQPFGGIPLVGLETRGRLSVALEVTRRLNAVIGKEVALIPAVTGPVTLAYLLRGPEFLANLESALERAYQAAEAALAVTVHVVKQYLDLGLDHLVVFDPLLGAVDPLHYPRLGSGLRTLWNVADFYDVRVLLQTRVDDDARVAPLRALAPGGLIIYGDAASGGATWAEGQAPGVAACPPPSLYLGEAGAVKAAAAVWRERSRATRALCVCSAIPRSAPPENVREVVRSIGAKEE